jgi:hypothetical protein
MTAAMAAAVLISALPAAAQTGRIDRQLETAAAKAFAARAGAIRGTFEANGKPEFVTVDAMEASGKPLGWNKTQAELKALVKPRVQVTVNDERYSSIVAIGN